MSSCLGGATPSRREREIHGLGAQQQELERFVRQVYPRSEWRSRAHGAWRAADSLLRRAQSWAVRHITGG